MRSKNDRAIEILLLRMVNTFLVQTESSFRMSIHPPHRLRWLLSFNTHVFAQKVTTKNTKMYRENEQHPLKNEYR